MTSYKCVCDLVPLFVRGSKMEAMDQEVVTNGNVAAPQQATVIVARPIILDVQMLLTTDGYYIKELSYKPLPTYSGGPQFWPTPDQSLRYLCFRHDPKTVPSHRIVVSDGVVCDRYTGLEINCGGVDYSDERVVQELMCYNLIFVKGQNKKKLLRALFERQAHMLPETPTVVNVDAVTLDEDDQEFCRQNRMTAAKFSFRFVYRRFAPYLSLSFDHDRQWQPHHPVFLTNVVLSDKRYGVMARGARPLWICPHDHRCGSRWFTSQRCSALNVGVLETLWYMMGEKDYNELVNRMDHETPNNRTAVGRTSSGYVVEHEASDNRVAGREWPRYNGRTVSNGQNDHRGDPERKNRPRRRRRPDTRVY